MKTMLHNAQILTRQRMLRILEIKNNLQVCQNVEGETAPLMKPLVQSKVEVLATIYRYTYFEIQNSITETLTKRSTPQKTKR